MKRIQKPKRLRKKSQGITIGLVSLAVALFVFSAALTLKPKVVESKPASVKGTVSEDLETVLVPMPTRAIARGEKLRDVPFTQVRWPVGKLNDQYLEKMEGYEEATALSALPKYLPIPLSAVSMEAFDKNAVVEGIPEGMRAITVRVDEESAVEGWARSGNFVDVILIRTSSDSWMGLEAKVIAERVKILSAEGSATPNTSATAPKAPKTVTLLTSQEEALKIKTASSIGKLTFALRGTGDESPTVSTAMDQRMLLGTSLPAREKKAFSGFAKGPDGKVYVLSGDSTRWLQTPDVPPEAPETFGQQQRAQMNFVEAPEQDDNQKGNSDESTTP